MTFIRLLVLDISTLLTRKHFANDSNISNKSKLVEMAIQRYLDRQTPICINNCTDSNHGECDVSSNPPFLLGICKCRPGWRGYDCSEADVPSKFYLYFFRYRHQLSKSLDAFINRTSIKPNWSRKLRTESETEISSYVRPRSISN